MHYENHYKKHYGNHYEIHYKKVPLPAQSRISREPNGSFSVCASPLIQRRNHYATGVNDTGFRVSARNDGI